MQRWAKAAASGLAVMLAAMALASISQADPAPVLNPGPRMTAAEFPNDPDFARCESQDPLTGCTDNEQTNLYGPIDGDTCRDPGNPVADKPHPDGGLPCWARNATDPEHSSGINMTGAWKQGNVGREDMLVAYIEGGVNYSNNSIRDALNNIYLNKGELPYPQGWDGNDLGTYDFDANGRFDIRDYAKDPRVNPACTLPDVPFVAIDEGTTRGCAAAGQHAYLNSVNIAGPVRSYLSPEDLIAVFGHCTVTNHELAGCPSGAKVDNDGNGYPNDISGWNTEFNTNDPQTDQLGYGHASSLLSLLVGQANNNFAGVGVCRECKVLPIKQGSEAIGKTDNWTPALLFAVDSGSKAVASVVVSYTYSSAGREAVKYAIDRNVLLSFDSNDFDSMDHTDGLLYNEVFPGNGVIADADGPAARSFRARSNVTSYGTHSVFSGGESTTSGATPFQAGFLGMVQSAAMNAVDATIIPRTLTPNEVRQVLMNTASQVVPETQHPTVPGQWPGNPGSVTDDSHTNWSTQYGYGRPNIGKATKLIMDGRVPPTALINSPNWYHYVNPARQKTLDIKGSVAPSAWGSSGIGWTLEWALGADPADTDFKTISTGTAAKSGVLGTLDLSKIPSSYSGKSPTSTTLPFGPEQYTVTLRLRARDGNGLKGEDRRAIGARNDPGMVNGFPKKISTEMSGAPTFADISGRREQDLLYSTYDGEVHVLDTNGKEIEGFPAKTRKLRSIDPNNPQGYPADSYNSVEALRDMRDPISGTAVGDLTGSGKLSIVATTASGWVYAWSPRGKIRDGFPVHSDPQFNTKPVPTPRAGQRNSRLPTRGNWSAPVLGDLKGNGRLSILMSSYDQRLYAWQPNGKPVPGWPVVVKLPASMVPPNPNDYVQDAKLIMPPAVADVLGTGKDQVFVGSNECVTSGGEHPYIYGIQPDGNNNPGGAFLPGWPVQLDSLAGCYDQSIDFVQEGSNAASIADYDGTGPKVTVDPVAGFPIVINGDGSVFRPLGGSCPSTPCNGIPPYFVSDGLQVGVTGQSAIGDLLGKGDPPNYVQPMAGGNSLTSALDTPGPASLPHTFESAWEIDGGDVLIGFPQSQDGFPFFSSPLISNLSSGVNRSIVDSNDSYWIHAYQQSGKEAPGFPKWTGQWSSFAGAVSDPSFNGRLRMAYGSREGYLFVWNVEGSPAKNNAWWHYRHDEHNSGEHGNDTRRPASAGRIKVKRTNKGRGRKAKLTWKASGDNGVSNGKVKRYEVYRSKKRINLSNLKRAKRMKAPKPRDPKKPMSITVKGKKKQFVAIRSVDKAGNVSALTNVKVKKAKHRHHHH